MPIIFASSFMMFVPVIAGYLKDAFERGGQVGFFTRFKRSFLQYDGYIYNVLYMILIVLFAYFWVSVQFQPKDMAKNLQDSAAVSSRDLASRQANERISRIRYGKGYFLWRLFSGDYCRCPGCGDKFAWDTTSHNELSWAAQVC